MIINLVFLYRNTQKEKKITAKYTPRGNWSYEVGIPIFNLNPSTNTSPNLTLFRCLAEQAVL